MPQYHVEADRTGDDFDYRVHFSSSPTKDAEGLISTTLGSSTALLEPDGKTCSTDFEVPLHSRPTALYEGTVYWQVVRSVRRTSGAPETPKQKEEREEREDEELDKEEAAFENGTVFEPKAELEGGPVRSFSLRPKVEEPSLETQRMVYAGYLSPIEFTSVTNLEGGTIELQRFVKVAWKPLRSVTVTEAPTNFFVKLPAGKVVLWPVAKSPSVTLPLGPQKFTVHKLRTRLTSAEEDGRYKQKRGKKSKEAKEETPKLPLSFAVVDGGTRVVHLRASIEATCAPATRNGEPVPLTIKTAVRSARIASDGTVIADEATKGAEPQQVTFVGQLLDGSLIGTVSASFKNCSGSRKFEAVPVRKKK